MLYEDPSGLFFKEVWNGVKNTGKKIVNAVKAGGKVIQSAASVAGKKLKEFASTNVGKVVIGVTVIALAGVATVLTGGMAGGFVGSVAYGFFTGALMGGAMGAAAGGTEAVLSNRMETGSWSGSMQAFTDGAASGFCQGTISGGVMGSIGAGVRYGANALGEVVNPLSKWMKTSDRTVGRPTQAQGFSRKGYNPKPGERTLNGYVEQNANPEISLYTDSAGFNNNGNIGGEFKRFGAEARHGINGPHVHQPLRNITPDGSVHGVVGRKTKYGGVTSPTAKDVKQLYDYINNGKYH